MRASVVAAMELVAVVTVSVEEARVLAVRVMVVAATEEEAEVGGVMEGVLAAKMAAPLVEAAKAVVVTVVGAMAAC